MLLSFFPPPYQTLILKYIKKQEIPSFASDPERLHSFQMG